MKPAIMVIIPATLARTRRTRRTRTKRRRLPGPSTLFSRPWLHFLSLSLLHSASATLPHHSGLTHTGSSPGNRVPMQGSRALLETEPSESHHTSSTRIVASVQGHRALLKSTHRSSTRLRASVQRHRALLKREFATAQEQSPVEEYLSPASQISRVCNTTGPVLLGVHAGDARTARWKGWGTSLAWFGDYIGGLPSKELKVFLDLLFSKKSGLGLNIVRYNIGGGFNASLSPQFATTGSKRFRAAQGFRPDPSKGYDWSADKNQRSVLLGARARGANTFVAFANSPPWWMTISGDPAGNVGGRSNLAPESFQAFADYLADVVHQYATNPSWNIPFRFLQPFNEPEGRRRQGNNQEGCHYDPGEVSRLIPLVDRALRQRGLDTKVVAIDGVPDAVTNYTLSLPPSVLKLIPQLAVHPYETTRSKNPIPATAKQFRAVAKTAQDLKKELWASEWGPNFGTGSDLGVSLYMARMIMESINLMGASAFVYWQAIDEEQDWSLINVQWGAKSAFPIWLSKKYSIMKQFTRLVRPGSVNIPLDAPEGCQLNTVAFYSPCRRRLTLFVVNQESVNRTISFKLSGFVPAWQNVAVTSTVYRTSKAEDFRGYAGPGVNLGKAVSVTAYGRSLVTVQITNVMPATGGARCAH